MLQLQMAIHFLQRTSTHEAHDLANIILHKDVGASSTIRLMALGAN